MIKKVFSDFGLRNFSGLAPRDWSNDMKEIIFENIGKVYSQGKSSAVAVDGVNLRIERGEFFFLLGPSGCGKTTLLRMAAGLMNPTSGRILFGDADMTNVPPERRNTAMVFQSYALWPHMTVEANVQFAPRMQGLDLAARKDRSDRALAMVRMADYAGRKPNQLSGGQQQRVALARALAAEADCLLLDEPLSNLDARLRSEMRGEIRSLVKQCGATAIYVTHDQAEALAMADRIAIMSAGRIVQVGTPAELYDRPANKFVATFIGEANVLSGRIVAIDGAAARIEFSPNAAIRVDVDGALRRPVMGETASVAFRPERLGVSDIAASGDDASLPATIIGVTYLGQVRQYECRLGDGAMVRVCELACGVAGRQIGQKVFLTLAQKDAVLLPD